MIWLTICQGVAQHVNNHADELRDRFVRHSGSLKLVVRQPDFFKGALDNDWPTFLDELSSQVGAQLIDGMHERFMPRFSTTSHVEQIAAEAALLECMQNYFNYSLEKVICGIPSITLEGNVDDWQSLAKRAEMFADLDLNWWLDVLRPILHQFARAARGEIDRPFWQSIYRQRDALCSPNPDLIHDQNATGWIIGLLPYLSDQMGQPTRPNPWLSDPTKADERQWLMYHHGPLAEQEKHLRQSRHLRKFRKYFDRGIIDDKELEGAELGYLQDAGVPTVGFFEEQIPTGVSRVPFTWTEVTPEGNVVSEHAMEFLSGFLGIEQDTQTLTLRPYIGWAVRRAIGRHCGSGKDRLPRGL